MYQHHFTSSDVNIAFELGSKKVYLDTAISVAYTTNITSVPIYELGSPITRFFSSGNTLVQGQLDIVFTGFEYIPKILSYLIDDKTFKPVAKKSSKDLSSLSVDGLQTLIESGYRTVNPDSYSDIKYSNLNTKNDKNLPTLSNKIGDSLVGFRQLIDISLDLDNMNATMNGSKSVLKIKGVKFMSHSFATTSRDDTSIILRYTFLAKDIERLDKTFNRI